MTVLGIVLLVLDLLVFHTGILWILGLVLAVVGGVLILGTATGRTGRHYW